MMNDLEFRQNLLTEPQQSGLCEDAQTPERQRLLNDVRQQDNDLKAALTVPVPANLQSRIILNQSLKDFEQRQRRRSRWHLAIAASLAFTAGTLLSFFTLDRGQLGFSQYALAHVYHEYSTMTDAVDEKATLATFNSKSAVYGATLTRNIGHIYYVNFCDFNGVKSLHAVFAGSKGRVTVFIIKNKVKAGAKEKSVFADGQFDGVTEQMGDHQIILIGEKGEPLNIMETKLKKNLDWST
ncbi:DUF3379 family protein [Gallaecimonas mangrovi]|uniref:DUF3379 family protein n=1 Tax=Gallaecimonas mangrovi TaxID=2291597 RepID=UPI000E1FBFB2|nr:DUF3379 family protein [Gallaecimonas mangrovi]